MSDWALGKKLNSQIADVPLNHLIWLNDYKTYGEDSYVFNDKDIWNELLQSYLLIANDVSCTSFYDLVPSKGDFIRATKAYSNFDFDGAISFEDAINKGQVSPSGLIYNSWYRKHYYKGEYTLFVYANPGTSTKHVISTSNELSIITLGTMTDAHYEYSPSITVEFSDGTKESFEFSKTTSTTPFYICGRIANVYIVTSSGLTGSTNVGNLKYGIMTA